MTNISTNPVPPNTALLAPDYGHHRNNVSSVDPAALTDAFYSNVKAGINMRGYEYAHIQVVPTGGANPSVEVLVWSPGADRFIAIVTPVTQAGVGVDTPYEFTFSALGRHILVRVTSLAAGTCDVYVSGASSIDRGC
jgi:hypothetical protein